MDSYLDTLALETAQAIQALEWRVFPGGPDQRLAATQVAIREALEKARRDAPANKVTDKGREEEA